MRTESTIFDEFMDDIDRCSIYRYAKSEEIEENILPDDFSSLASSQNQNLINLWIKTIIHKLF